LVWLVLKAHPAGMCLNVFKIIKLELCSLDLFWLCRVVAELLQNYCVLVAVRAL